MVKGCQTADDLWALAELEPVGGGRRHYRQCVYADRAFGAAVDTSKCKAAVPELTDSAVAIMRATTTALAILVWSKLSPQ
jgi:hypothetical protein